MAIVSMKKLTLAVANSVKDNVISDLQSLGAVHVDQIQRIAEEEGALSDTWAETLTDASIDVSQLEDQRKEISTALTRIHDFCGVVTPSFEVTSSEKVKALRAKYDLKTLAAELNQLDQQTKERDVRINLLTYEIQEIKKWSHTVDDFDPIHGKSNVLAGTLGHIAESSLEGLQTALKEATTLADVLVAYISNKEAYCYVVSSPEIWDTVSSVLKDQPFHPLMITRRSGNTDQMLQEMQRELEQAQKDHAEFMTTWQSYSQQIDELALLHDMLEMDIQHQRALGRAVSSEQVSFFKAWVPEQLLPKVTAILSIYEKSIDVTIEDPSDQEYDNVPVSLQNNALTKPFAALTNMYGTPKYGATVDPTPHISIFYFIYYGVCLGDALYGAVLALFSCWMMFKNRANQGMSNFYALLAWSGFSAVVAGVVFGSYAGDLFSKYIQVPALTDLSFRFSDGQAFFDKPLFVLFASLLIGAIQLWYGYWIKFYLAIKNNGFVSALTHEFPWLVLLAGFFGWAVFDWIASLAGLTLIEETTRNIMFLLMKLGAGMVILFTTIRGFQKGFVAGVTGPLAGAWELYGISGYLSNLLSYARLLALGLSSGIIANVFNDIGMGLTNTLVEITPVLGILGVVLVVFLHVFNLVLGGFGAFVHALRLQFVEFFGQFMEGGGKEYQPLQCKGSHYTVR